MALLVSRRVALPLATRAFGSTGGGIAGAAVAALFFGAGHIPQGFLAAAMIAVVGFLLGVIMTLHRSVWPSVVAHGLFDAASIAMLPWAMQHFQEWQRLAGTGVGGGERQNIQHPTPNIQFQNPPPPRACVIGCFSMFCLSYECITWPPSMLIVWPVIFCACSEARKTAMAAYSAGVFKGPSGDTLRIFLPRPMS